jgi:catechol 2,3-dioxygenase-like lactoylglutathione lyase family enzyme
MLFVQPNGGSTQHDARKQTVSLVNSRMTRAHLQVVHPVLAVRDVPAALHFYELLGFTLAFRDSTSNAQYAGIRRDHVELHLQWHDANEWNHPVDRPTYRIVVDDVDALHSELTALAQPFDITPVSDMPWGTREFPMRDPEGNGLQFYRESV